MPKTKAPKKPAAQTDPAQWAGRPMPLKPLSYSVALVFKHNPGLTMRQWKVAHELRPMGWNPPIKPLRPILENLVRLGILSESLTQRGNIKAWAWTLADKPAKFRLGKYTVGLEDDDD